MLCVTHFLLEKLEERIFYRLEEIVASVDGLSVLIVVLFTPNLIVLSSVFFSQSTITNLASFSYVDGNHLVLEQPVLLLLVVIVKLNYGSRSIPW